MALITPSEAKEKIRTSPTGEEKQNQSRPAVLACSFEGDGPLLGIEERDPEPLVRVGLRVNAFCARAPQERLIPEPQPLVNCFRLLETDTPASARATSATLRSLGQTFLLDAAPREHRVTLIGFPRNSLARRTRGNLTRGNSTIGLGSYVRECSTSIFADDDSVGPAPNSVTPGGATPTLTAPSIAGGL